MIAKARILVVDDEQSMREFLEIFFRGEGYEVMTAPDVDSALLAVDSDDFDVVISDIQMPGRSGLDVAAEIRRRGLATRVVILTTFDHDEYVIEALGAGAAGFLIKNTEPAQLLRGIRLIAGGEALLSPGLTRRLIAQLTARTPPPDSTPTPWPNSPPASGRSSDSSPTG